MVEFGYVLATEWCLREPWYLSITRKGNIHIHGKVENESEVMS